jgi:hypothetical protein
MAPEAEPPGQIAPHGVDARPFINFQADIASLRRTDEHSELGLRKRRDPGLFQNRTKAGQGARIVTSGARFGRATLRPGSRISLPTESPETV